MKRLCFIALLFVLLAFPSGVRADVAPPYYPPGSNPQPGTEVTQVRMAAETVLIEVQKDITPESLGRARVTADFTMHNLGTADESMAVRFPIAGKRWAGRLPGDRQPADNGQQESGPVSTRQLSGCRLPEWRYPVGGVRCHLPSRAGCSHPRRIRSSRHRLLSVLQPSITFWRPEQDGRIPLAAPM